MYARLKCTTSHCNSAFRGQLFAPCLFFFYNTAMRRFGQADLDTLLPGSAFLGAGGGFSKREHRKIFLEALKSGPVRIRNIGEFQPHDYLATVYGVGDPSKARSMHALLPLALEEFQKLSGRRIAGIIPGEIGAEGVAFQAAAAAQLPVVDADLVGGRAAPEIQMDAFAVHSKAITPVFALAKGGKSIYLQGPLSAKEVEDLLRLFFDRNGSNGILVGYSMLARDARRIVQSGTLSLTQRVGALLNRRDAVQLKKFLAAKLLTDALMRRAELFSSGGFLRGYLQVGEYKICVQNEHLAAMRNRRLVVRAPDILALLAADTMHPIHNSEAQKYVGKRVQLWHAPARGYWKLARAKKLWNESVQGAIAWRKEKD